MPTTQPGDTIAVTGAAGYIGGWVVEGLLARGYRVRAGVRNPDDLDRTGFLRSMPAYASTRLTLHRFDVDQPETIQPLIENCDGLAHVAHVSTYDDPAYLLRVCDDIVQAIDRVGTLKRVVLTSSIAAVIAEADIQELVRRPVIDEDRVPDESNPKRTPERGLGYSISKNIAQQAFTEGASRLGTWDTITCCPGDNIGPILSPHHATGAWQGQIRAMLSGRYVQTAAYRPWMPVDVRDDADCHIGLLESASVNNGERFLAWSTDRMNAEDICASISRLLPELGHIAPAITDPFNERVQSREAELRAIWAGCELRNDRIRNAVPVSFRSLDTSIRDTVESLMSVAGVQVLRN
jgi:nucleoside-diphosphate-sugar epimerase